MACMSIEFKNEMIVYMWYLLDLAEHENRVLSSIRIGGVCKYEEVFCSGIWRIGQIRCVWRL